MQIDTGDITPIISEPIDSSMLPPPPSSISDLEISSSVSFFFLLVKLPYWEEMNFGKEKSRKILLFDV